MTVSILWLISHWLQHPTCTLLQSFPGLVAETPPPLRQLPDFQLQPRPCSQAQSCSSARLFHIPSRCFPCFANSARPNTLLISPQSVPPPAKASSRALRLKALQSAWPPCFFAHTSSRSAPSGPAGSSPFRPHAGSDHFSPPPRPPLGPRQKYYSSRFCPGPRPRPPPNYFQSSSQGDSPRMEASACLPPVL